MLFFKIIPIIHCKFARPIIYLGENRIDVLSRDSERMKKNDKKNKNQCNRGWASSSCPPHSWCFWKHSGRPTRSLAGRLRLLCSKMLYSEGAPSHMLLLLPGFSPSDLRSSQLQFKILLYMCYSTLLLDISALIHCLPSHSSNSALINNWKIQN